MPEKPMKPKKQIKPRGMLMYWLLVALICVPPLVGHFLLVAPTEGSAQAAPEDK